MRPMSCRPVLLLALVAACGDDGSATDPDARRVDAEVPIDAVPADASGANIPEDLPSPLPTGPVDAEVITFNIGMIQTVRGSEQRMPHILAAIEASNADIVCLQEVYLQYTSPLEFATELEDVYPYAAWTWETTNTVSNGLLIVSKVPLYRQRFLRYTQNDINNTVDRAVLAATAVDDAWHLHVLCTHLQAGLDTPNANIRMSQIAELGDFAIDEGYATGPSVLLGDYNSGPDPDPTDAECPDQGNCADTCTPTDVVSPAQIVAQGWTDRAPDLGFDLCTWCKPYADALALLPFYACDSSQRIDGCYSRGLGTSQISAIDRVMDATDLTIDIGNGMTAATLSDHMGVQCSLAPP